MEIDITPNWTGMVHRNMHNASYEARALETWDDPKVVDAFMRFMSDLNFAMLCLHDTATVKHVQQEIPAINKRVQERWSALFPDEDE